MQFRVFSIHAAGAPEIEEEMNQFLNSHRVISVQKSLELWDGAPRWCFCVEYLDGDPPSTTPQGSRKGRIDYKEILSAPDFKVYTRLRDVRKELAAADGDPVYTVGRNDQLASMAVKRPKNLAELKQINGFGEAKAKKYGEALLAAINQKEGDDETKGGT